MKIQKQLSPEKYIITKSRSLEIGKCYVLKGYEKEKITQVVISRKHKNGNISFCFYLVDLACLGIKDTFYNFNISSEEFGFLHEKAQEDSDGFEEIDYITAHNIIFVAYEYALDLELKPHKDFEKITKYFLEEDDDNIPLVDVKCGGDDGKPLYIQGRENHTEAMKIIRTLEKNLGEDGFNYILRLESYNFDDDFDDDDYFDPNLFDEEELGKIIEEVEEKKKSLEQLSFEEKRAKYLSNDKNERIDVNLPFTEIELLKNLLFANYKDDKKIEEIYKQYQYLEEISLAEQVVPESLLGNSNMAFFDGDEDMIEECIGLLIESDTNHSFFNKNELAEHHQEMKEAIFGCQQRYPDLPITKYLMARLEQSNPRIWEKLEQEYPDYALFSIEKYISAGQFEEVISKDFFSSRKEEISSSEMYRYLMALLQYIIKEQDVNYHAAFFEIVEEIDLYDDERYALNYTNAIAKSKVLEDLLSRNVAPLHQ